jgi:predicted ATP-binding protein involved in virulence
LQDLFGEAVRLVFELGALQYQLEYPDGRVVALVDLPDGYASALEIVAEIAMRMDVLQGRGVDPTGLMLIDEVEAHLHLTMQERILPTLTAMFPRIQFVVATHSPAILASLDNATVYDLGRQQVERKSMIAKPYGQLAHDQFGVSEFSLTMESKIRRFKESLTEHGREAADTQALAAELAQLSPILALEVQRAYETLERG